MARKTPKTVLYRRKREKKTNYKKRLHLLLSTKPRLVVRFSNTRVIGQVVMFAAVGDKVEVGVDSTCLKQHGWNYSFKNFPASYLTGFALGLKAKAKGITEAILDTGFRTPLHKGRVFAFLQGFSDAGVHVPHDKNVLPLAEHVTGGHIVNYAAHLKSDDVLYKKQFSKYIKSTAKPEDIASTFESVKKKLQS